MKCRRCNGRMFLDRVFTDNKNFEVYCILCGHRQFIGKGSPQGRWLEQMERRRKSAGSLA